MVKYVLDCFFISSSGGGLYIKSIRKREKPVYLPAGTYIMQGYRVVDQRTGIQYISV